jgi:hypothetical protein
MESIRATYIEEESYQRRLAVLEAEGFAVREPAGFRLTARGRRLAGAVAAIQGAFAIRASG